MSILTRTPDDVVYSFDIPDELAQELARNLSTSAIRRSLLLELIDKPSKYDEIEKTLIPIYDRIEAIKSLITNEYVPKEYRTELYQWIFPGYEVAGGTCWIKKT